LQALKIALAQIRICSRLEAVLLKKKKIKQWRLSRRSCSKGTFLSSISFFGKGGRKENKR